MNAFHSDHCCASCVFLVTCISLHVCVCVPVHLKLMLDDSLDLICIFMLCLSLLACVQTTLFLMMCHLIIVDKW